MPTCQQVFGCHACRDNLMLIHAELRQFLREPAGNLERLRAQAIATKQFIECIVSTDEKEDGDGHNGDVGKD